MGSTVKKRYTHFGWFDLCPVLIGFPDGETFDLKPRWFWAEPLFWLAVQLQGLAIGFCSLVNPEWEPVWMVRITGEIE